MLSLGKLHPINPCLVNGLFACHLATEVVAENALTPKLFEAHLEGQSHHLRLGLVGFTRQAF
jgi:hypothetical protein